VDECVGNIAGSFEKRAMQGGGPGGLAGLRAIGAEHVIGMGVAMWDIERAVLVPAVRVQIDVNGGAEEGGAVRQRSLVFGGLPFVGSVCGEAQIGEVRASRHGQYYSKGMGWVRSTHHGTQISSPSLQRGKSRRLFYRHQGVAWNLT
jgi:hypothetical protein